MKEICTACQVQSPSWRTFQSITRGEREYGETGSWLRLRTRRRGPGWKPFLFSGGAARCRYISLARASGQGISSVGWDLVSTRHPGAARSAIPGWRRAAGGTRYDEIEDQNARDRAACVDRDSDPPGLRSPRLRRQRDARGRDRQHQRAERSWIRWWWWSRRLRGLQQQQ